jgi:hypothetical protein
MRCFISAFAVSSAPFLQIFHGPCVVIRWKRPTLVLNELFRALRKTG